jgi:uncharacterized protein YjbI with pentapeptide repeats
LSGGEAQLQGASLVKAQLQGGSLVKAELQGASLVKAQLQGASLHQAQLQVAGLSSAQLQGARLNRAQLQGAWLDGARMQAASLDGAQMQGATLFWAYLEGATFDHTAVWRADLYGDMSKDVVGAGKAASARVVSPDPNESFGCRKWHDQTPHSCKTPEKNFEVLRQSLSAIPDGKLKVAARNRLKARFQPESFELDGMVLSGLRDVVGDIAYLWGKASETPLGPEALLASWREIGCQGNGVNYAGAPYVARALLGQLDETLFENEAPAKAKLASAFLKPDCAGAKGLSETEIAQLKEIAAAAAPQ